jgi:lipopolysaccharide/colanic/teichoic acid biosynthesis glycosyltransferase
VGWPYWPGVDAAFDYPAGPLPSRRGWRRGAHARLRLLSPASPAAMSKRAFDLVGAAAALTLLAPAMLGVALWIKLDSRGPACVRELRVGRGGLVFRAVSFRTLSEQAPSGQGSGNEHRIPRAGRILRRYQLDKLPQLLNVLQGTMSLVGPAPALPEVLASYPPNLRTLALSLTPGITDWSCALERDERALLRGAVDADLVFLDKILPKRLEYYARYREQRSLWLDLRIILHSLSTLAD